MNKKQKRYSLFLDALRVNVVNILMIMFLWVIIDSIDLFNPFDDVLEDFDYTDLYYSNFKSSQLPTDTNIFIVNIGELNRMDLALMINTLQRFEPKVIGVDAVFKEKRGPEDLFLRQALTQKDNIVLGVFGKYNKEDATGIIKHHPFFGEHTIGHLEFITPNGTTREFEKYIEYNDTVVNHFALEIMKKYDSIAYLSIAERKGQVELINYRGGQVPFITFNYEEISDSNQNLSLIKDKIVLLGYMGQYANAPFDTLDSHFTPLKSSGEIYPDAKGIEVHAHVLSMMLRGDYISKMPEWLNYLLAFVILQLFIMFCIYIYVHKSKYFDFITKPSQFIAIAIVLWGTFSAFKGLKLKFDMVPTALALILSVEVLYLYEEALQILKINTYITQNLKFDKHGKKSKKKKKPIANSNNGISNTGANDSPTN
jgi:CHASE2 domain-containing sensor protein